MAENALDDDYYVVRAGEPYGERPVGTVAVGVVVALLAALVTVAAVQTQTARPGSELERETLAADIADRREVLAARESAVQALREQVASLQGGELLEVDTTSSQVLSGAEAVQGEGVVVTLAGGPDRPLGAEVDVDDVLQTVNGLWYAGAEAISVGGQRLTSMTPISSLDGTLQVNFTRIDVPVEIMAIGDADTLRSRLDSNAAGRYLQGRAASAGLSYDVAASDELVLPAAPEKRALPTHADALTGDGGPP